jgi:D-alanyl-D-alanine carboxypeptidase
MIRPAPVTTPRAISGRWHGAGGPAGPRARTALAVLWLFAIGSLAFADADLVPPPPEVEAASAILVQAQSGAVLYEKDAFAARPPASLTKMVTALVVVDRCRLDAVATVSANAAAAEGSTLGLHEGERLTVGELLKGLLLPSGNDAACCLAEHVGRSEAAFVELMNAKAAGLGAVNTHFVNASGLTAEGHYSCARDLAVFAMAVRRHPYLSQIIGLTAAEVKWCAGRTKAVDNLNRLLARCEGCDGVKTGFTTPAGRCLAASARRDGYSLVSVVLRSPDSWGESGALLNWGFRQPPVAVVEIPAKTADPATRLAAPVVHDRLYVPVSEFTKALGGAEEERDGKVRVTVGGQEMTCSVADGWQIGGTKRDLSAPPVTWCGQVAAPAADLCRWLGLELAFDKATLTATVGPVPTTTLTTPPATPENR